uniref:PlsC domain-containing protein n=1 Tax=Steinernema glaseri TaxID=37863 RepID=A0A1I7YQF6_9BILA
MTMGPGEPPLVTQTGPKEKIRGAIYCGMMLLSALLGSMYILFPLFPLIFLKPTWWRKIVDRMVGFWLVLPSVSVGQFVVFPSTLAFFLQHPPLPASWS